MLDYTTVATDDADRAWSELQYVPSGSASGFPTISGSTADDAAPLLDLISKLKPVYRANARWLMNRATASVLQKLRDADGRFLWRESLEEGQPDRLKGYPVELSEDMPDIAANALSIAFGNFHGYVIVDRRRITLLRDPFTTKGYVKLYSTKRVGGGVVDFDAIKFMKFAVS